MVNIYQSSRECTYTHPPSYI